MRANNLDVDPRCHLGGHGGHRGGHRPRLRDYGTEMPEKRRPPGTATRNTKSEDRHKCKQGEVPKCECAGRAQNLFLRGIVRTPSTPSTPSTALSPRSEERRVGK